MSTMAAQPLAPHSRGLHSSTSQLNVSAFWGLHTSTFRLEPEHFLWAILGDYIDKNVSG